MKISYDWLSDYLDWIETDPARIADRLTTGMGEVDEVEIQGALLKHVVVGKVLSVSKHLNADTLNLAEVETEQGVKEVVCGGTNLRMGMLVAFAHVGATVRGHGEELVTLQRVKIRGEDSEGMICAAEELGLEESFPPRSEDGNRPIIDLTDLKLKVGAPLRTALKLDDVVFHIDNHAITNRPDLFSHIGVARECVALGLAKWKRETKVKRPAFPKNSSPFKIFNDAKDLVPRYHSCTISIEGLGTTPEWMKRRLEATGWRSINPPIDITNYVMMETGMPLHSFDADDFRGDLRIRLSKKGERMTTLDETEHMLPDDVLVISDDEGIFDLLGIMGGLRSSTKDSTVNIFLQAAIMEPSLIRKAVIALGHRTDAATVFEKGVPFPSSLYSLSRAVELFLELCPGATLASKLLEWGKDTPAKRIDVSAGKMEKMIGETLPAKKMKQMLTDLGFSVSVKGKAVSVTVPAHRNDICEAADIVEEVARVRGYGAIPLSMPAADITPPVRDFRLHKLRDALKTKRYIELVELALVGPKLLTDAGFDPAEAVSIENPIGEELSLMRLSLLPAMLATAQRQMEQSGEDLKLYEVGHVFAPGSERMEACLLIAKRSKTNLKTEPLLELKSDLVHGFRAMGYELKVEASRSALPDRVHPGRAARLLCQGKEVGSLYELHPIIRSHFDLPERVAVTHIDWDTVRALKPQTRLVSPLPAFPSISYDETIPLPERGTTRQFIENARTVSPLLRKVSIADLYQKEDDKRVTLRFTYRADDRTLKQEETDTIHRKVLEQL